MKKIALLLVLALVLGCFSFAYAEEGPVTYESGDYKYILLDDGTAEIVKYTGKDKALVLPAELNGYKVSSIGGHAFSECLFLAEITLPDSMTQATMPSSGVIRSKKSLFLTA